MSVRMKTLPTDLSVKVIIETQGGSKIYYVDSKDIIKVESSLKKYSKESEAPVAWEVLAKERIEKYKKAGLVLRGMRYREGMSQKELASKSGVSQNEISKIENGKRTVGKKVAEKLAEVLNFNYRLLLEVS